MNKVLNLIVSIFFIISLILTMVIIVTMVTDMFEITDLLNHVDGIVLLLSWIGCVTMIVINGLILSIIEVDSNVEIKEVSQ